MRKTMNKTSRFPNQRVPARPASGQRRARMAPVYIGRLCSRQHARQGAPRAELDSSGMLVFDSIDSDTCPADCVEEVLTPVEFKRQCEAAGSSLVVVDFYKTSCGSCKYVMPAFKKICQATYETDEGAGIVFLKHNVFDDEEEEKTDLARRLRIVSVPTIMLFKNMEMLEHFATRDKARIIEAVKKYSDVDLEIEV